MRSMLTALLLAGNAALAVAQDAPRPPELQPVPDEQAIQQDIQTEQQQDALAPEVTIIRRDGGTVSEYRVNGKMYMVKVTPDKGVPYYLIDSDGDGDLETRRNEMDPGIAVPSWILLRW